MGRGKQNFHWSAQQVPFSFFLNDLGTYQGSATVLSFGKWRFKKHFLNSFQAGESGGFGVDRARTWGQPQTPGFWEAWLGKSSRLMFVYGLISASGDTESCAVGTHHDKG